MANSEVTVICWLCGHQELLHMTKQQELSLEAKIKKLKAVCPNCRNNERGNQPIFIASGRTLYSQSKIYKCTAGHITAVSLFTNNMLHVKFGNNNEDFINIDGHLNDLENLVDSGGILCHNTNVTTGSMCGCNITPIDDYELSYVEGANIKTKTRVGDIWDKQRLEPVRNGQYDSDGHYHGTTSEKANKARLAKIRERNIKEDNMPGQRIDKPTNTIYKPK